MSTKWVYFFGNGQTDGQQGNRNLVGGKGANLAEMVALGIPVWRFTMRSLHCFANGERHLMDLKREENLAWKSYHKFVMLQSFVGTVRWEPLSMPGMMDTVLNLGLNDETKRPWLKRRAIYRFAWIRHFAKCTGGSWEWSTTMRSAPAAKDERALNWAAPDTGAAGSGAPL